MNLSLPSTTSSLHLLKQPYSSIPRLLHLTVSWSTLQTLPSEEYFNNTSMVIGNPFPSFPSDYSLQKSSIVPLVVSYLASTCLFAISVTASKEGNSTF